MELPDEDQPDERLWLDPDGLEQHFADVRSRRESKSSGREPIESGDAVQNQFTAALRR